MYLGSTRELNIIDLSKKFRMAQLGPVEAGVKV